MDIKKKAADKNDISLYYSAVNALKTKEKPTKWDVRNLFPGDSDEEIANKVADYFNTISSEFSPLAGGADGVGNDFPELLPYQIAGRLRAFRKPKTCLLYTSPSPRD